MNRSLVIKPSGLPESKNRPWALVLRQHDLGGTDYETVALMTDDMAGDVADAQTVTWLYGSPNWGERARLQALEKARVMHEEAAKIEAANAPKVEDSQIGREVAEIVLDMGGSTPHSG